MRIFIAASHPRKAEAEALAWELPHEIISTWHRTPDTDPRLATRTDMAQVRHADAVVCITGDSLTRGGRHHECGAAIALDKPVLLLGPRECVHHHHPLVRQCNTLEELCSLLKAFSRSGSATNSTE